MIKMTYDLHTHSIYSDGKNTIEENVQAAITKGLTQIGITDHAYRHITYGVRLKQLDAYLKTAQAVKKAYKDDINVLVGMEFNLLRLDGEIDMPRDYKEEFDIKLLGMHKAVLYSNAKSFSYLLAAQLIKPIAHSKAVVAANTQAFIRAIVNYKIDVLVHPNYLAQVDIGQIAKACKNTGIKLEINARHNNMTKEDVRAILKTKTNFVLSSDAHRAEQIGVHGYADAFVKTHHMALERIENAERV